MHIHVLKSKIHRAVVSESALNYVGSITIDEDLMDACGMVEYEKVQVANVDNGSRLETYVIAGERGSGMICLNGAAARYAAVGDKVIIMSYAEVTPEEFKENPPRVVYKTMMTAPMIIAIWYSMPKRLLNSVPTALNPDAV